MNIKYAVTLLVVGSCLLIHLGCATVSQQEVASANFGPYPNSYEADIRNLMSQMLKDPDSANYKFGAPRKGVFQNGASFLGGGQKYFGYIIPTGINAKNSFGGYTGEQVYYYIISEGRVFEITSQFQTGMAKYVE